MDQQQHGGITNTRAHHSRRALEQPVAAGYVHTSLSRAAARVLVFSRKREVDVGRLHVIHAPPRLYPNRTLIESNKKFGDPPLRQWWRAKQNVDYAFLMWHSLPGDRPQALERETFQGCEHPGTLGLWRLGLSRGSGPVSWVVRYVSGMSEYYMQLEDDIQVASSQRLSPTPPLPTARPLLIFRSSAHLCLCLEESC